MFFSPENFLGIMILLYFRRLKLVSISFSFLTFNELRCDLCHKNTVCFCGGHLSPSNYHASCAFLSSCCSTSPELLTLLTSFMKRSSPLCTASAPSLFALLSVLHGHFFSHLFLVCAHS